MRGEGGHREKEGREGGGGHREEGSGGGEGKDGGGVGRREGGEEDCERFCFFFTVLLSRDFTIRFSRTNGSGGLEPDLTGADWDLF